MAYQYAFMGKTITLYPDTNYVAVRFKDPSTRTGRAFASMRAGLENFPGVIELPGEKYTIYPVPDGLQPLGIFSARARTLVESNDDVVNVVPVFKSGDRRIVATDRVLAGISADAVDALVFLRDIGCEILEARDDERLIRIPEDRNAFDVANALVAFEGVSYAEPDFVTLGTHVALKPESWLEPVFDGIAAPGPVLESQREPNAAALSTSRADPDASGMFFRTRSAGPMKAADPLLGQQYAPRITRAVDAWSVLEGNPGIRIAILDEGVDLEHEDLGSRIVGSYDGILDVSPQRLNPWDGHGTACAGLAAAIPDNGIGIRGIGGGCSLLAIRIAQSPGPGKDWFTTNNVIVRSIDWAWRNDADVLSNSWGGGTPSTAIVNAFERARTKGRNGKGAVIVIAVGNHSGPVGFPANMPDVLAVSASNEFDEFKTKSSGDGEYWWGSNFGPEVSVSAPGVHNLTTDISGGAGYAPGNYTDFNGTSSACPIVAGAAGLILSANAHLKEAEVRRIIRETADKVDRYPYMNDRNDQHGYGRLNVFKAVQSAIGLAVKGGQGP